MNIAELFVSLGVKGSERTIGALSSVRKGLGEISTMSLQATAALTATAYGFERLTAVSGMMGTTLTNFSALTGFSARQLQQRQYAARQAGLSGEELTGSFKNVQNAMTNMLLGKGAPEGLGLLANKVGFDQNKARDTFYVLEQLQKFAKSAPSDVGNIVLKSFGLSEGTVAAMRRNSFNPATMNRAPTYGDNEINSLNKANIAWSNLGNKIEMAIGHFNAKHGAQLVHDLTTMVDKIEKLIEAVAKIADKFKIFEIFGKYLDDWAAAFNTAAQGVDKLGNSKGLESITSKLGFLTSNTAGGDISRAALGGAAFSFLTGKDVMKGAIGSALSQAIFDYFSADKKTEIDSFLNGLAIKSGLMDPSLLAPKVYGPSPAGGTSNVEVNQTLNFQHDGKDHKQTADSVKKAAQHFVRQNPSQGRAT